MINKNEILVFSGPDGELIQLQFSHFDEKGIAKFKRVDSITTEQQEIKAVLNGVLKND